MAAKIISQRKWAKLVASTGPLSQPPGAITRLSNLLFTQRGSLQIADGSKFITNASISDFHFESISGFANLVSGQFPYLVAMGIPSASSSPGSVPNFTATPMAGAGNPSGQYIFGISGINSLGGHSDIFPTFVTVAAVVPFSSINFTWTALPGSVTYQIWMTSWPSRIGGSNFTGVEVASGLTGTSYSLSGVIPLTPIANTPAGDSTFSLTIYSSGIAAGGSVDLSIAASQFPSFQPFPSAQVPGSPSFLGALIATYVTPYGGVSGVCFNLPESVQFAGKSILILGNGYPPQEFDPTSPSTPAVPLTNTFQAAYPTWQPSVAWLTGSQVTDGAGNYFTATQGGVSQTPGPPSWNITLGTETADGSVIWTSQGPIISLVAPRGAAHAIAYAGSLWLANTYPTTTSDGIDGPTCIKMSDANNPNSWNPVNTAFIGRNDGTQITGMQPFTIAALGISPTGSLCVFKEYTTYQVIGVFGSTSFEIQPAQTNLGCLAARSIQFIPGFGVVRFSHLGFAVFDGINDRLISEDIRPYLFGGVDSEADLVPVDPQFMYLSQSAQTAQPPMYLCAMPLTGSNGVITRLFCYDLVMKAWAVLDLPWAITSLSAISVGEGYPLVLAGKVDGSVQRLQSGDINWDQGDDMQAAVQWSFRSPDVFGEGSSQRIFVEQISIRGYGNSAMAASIVAKLWLDGQQIGAQAIDIVPQGGSNLFECRVAIFRNGERFHLDVSGNNGGAAGTIDALDWAVVPKSAMARRIIG